MAPSAAVAPSADVAPTAAVAPSAAVGTATAAKPAFPSLPKTFDSEKFFSVSLATVLVAPNPVSATF